jgi:hypothetical protein
LRFRRRKQTQRENLNSKALISHVRLDYGRWSSLLSWRAKGFRGVNYGGTASQSGWPSLPGKQVLQNRCPGVPDRLPSCIRPCVAADLLCSPGWASRGLGLDMRAMTIRRKKRNNLAKECSQCLAVAEAIQAPGRHKKGGPEAKVGGRPDAWPLCVDSLMPPEMHCAPKMIM